MHIQSAECGTGSSRTTRQLKRALVMAAIAGAIGLGTTHSWADTYGNNGGTNLSLNTSWIDETTSTSPAPVAPGSGDIAAWDANDTLGTATTYTLGADTAWQGILIKNPTAAVTIDTALNNLTLGSSGIDMSSATVNLTLDPLNLILSAPRLGP